MSAIVLDGKAIAGELRARAREAALSFAAHAGRAPGLAVVLVGDDPASHVYVAAKGKASEACSIRSFETRLPAETTTETLLAHIMRLNAEPTVDGILVQLPLPKQIDETRIIAAIDPAKDVDGLTPASLGALVSGAEGLLPCTPAGCVLLAKRARASLAGLHAVIVGRSTIVGKPAALLFLREDCTVTIAHSRTRDLPDLCRSADILVAAVGRPEMIRGDAIKPGAIVIDVGINRLPAKDGGNRLVGDVAFAEAGHAGFITPVPGGVGPMTIAGLMRNTVIAAYRRAGHTPPAME